MQPLGRPRRAADRKRSRLKLLRGSETQAANMRTAPAVSMRRKNTAAEPVQRGRHFRAIFHADTACTGRRRHPRIRWRANFANHRAHRPSSSHSHPAGAAPGSCICRRGTRRPTGCHGIRRWGAAIASGNAVLHVGADFRDQDGSPEGRFLLEGLSGLDHTATFRESLDWWSYDRGGAGECADSPS